MPSNIKIQTIYDEEIFKNCELKQVNVEQNSEKTIR